MDIIYLALAGLFWLLTVALVKARGGPARLPDRRAAAAGGLLVNAPAWMQLFAYLAILLLLSWPLARAVEAVMAGRFALGRRVEAPLFRIAGVDTEHEQGWLSYTVGLLVFNGLGVLAVYALQRLQGGLPLNPQAWRPCPPDWPSTPRSASSPTPTGRLRRRVHDELPHPDGWADGAELRLGRHRHRRGHGLTRGFARHSAQTSAISGST
jgi:hypothetical protein